MVANTNHDSDGAFSTEGAGTSIAPGQGGEIGYEKSAGWEGLAAVAAVCGVFLLFFGLSPTALFTCWGVLFGCALGTTIFRQRKMAAQRSGDYQQWASKHGFAHSRVVPSKFLELFKDSYLLNTHCNMRGQNLAIGSHRDLQVAVFDMRAWSRGSDSGETTCTCVAINLEAGELPEFLIRPADFATWLKRLVSRKQLKLDETEVKQAFSKKYEVICENEQAFRDDVSPALLHHLATDPGWMLAKHGGSVLVMRVGSSNTDLQLANRHFQLTGWTSEARHYVRIEDLDRLLMMAIYFVECLEGLHAAEQARTNDTDRTN